VSFLLRRIDVSTDLERAALRRIGHAVARLFARRPSRRPVTVAEPKARSYVVLDADALDAFGRREPAAYAVVVRLTDLGARIVVPATALLGARVHGDVPGGVTIVTLDAALARKTARLVSDTRLALPFDAVLVACVPDGIPATIVTADAVAARAFARAAGRPDLTVVPLRP
jgi:hypothetical protein